MEKKAKIIATLGPAISSTSQLKKIIELGVDAFRINFSHNTKNIKNVVNRIRNLEIAMGKDKRELTSKQIEERKAIRRSPYSLKKIHKGESIQNIEVEFRRPGFGMTPSEWEELVKSNAIINNSIEASEILKLDMFS